MSSTNTSLPRLTQPSGIIPWIRGLFSFSFTLLWLFPSLLLVNLAQALSAPFVGVARHSVRKLNRWLAHTWWNWGVFATRKLLNVHIEFTGDEIPSNENVILIANHQTMPDIPLLLALAERVNRTGDLKWFVKDPIKWVPGVGWGMQFLDCIFVKREWEKDLHLVQKMFDRYLRERFPFWVISFSEGTRITPSKLTKSNAYCERVGIAPFRRVMLPRTKGFIASTQMLRSRLDAIYDVTLIYPDGIPTLFEFGMGWNKRARVHVKRYPIGTIPEQAEALNQWLIERFREKDDLLSTPERTNLIRNSSNSK